jgi:hypothetical protein
MDTSSTEKKCESCGLESCSGNCGVCNCSHHKAIPVFIILIAITFLCGQWGIIAPETVDVVWPVLLGAIGVTKLMRRACKCC